MIISWCAALTDDGEPIVSLVLPSGTNSTSSNGELFLRGCHQDIGNFVSEWTWMCAFRDFQVFDVLLNKHRCPVVLDHSHLSLAWFHSDLKIPGSLYIFGTCSIIETRRAYFSWTVVGAIETQQDFHSSRKEVVATWNKSGVSRDDIAPKGKK